MGETNWLKQNKKEGMKVKKKSKPLKESMENMNENEDIKKIKSINKKKSLLTKLPVMESIYEPIEEKRDVKEVSKPEVVEGFENSNECTEPNEYDFADKELENELTRLGLKTVVADFNRLLNGEVDSSETEITNDGSKPDRWCKGSDKKNSVLSNLSFGVDLLPAMVYAFIPGFQWCIKKMAIRYCQVWDTIRNDTKCSKEKDHKLAAQEFLRLIGGYTALFVTYNWFFLWCYKDAHENHLDEDKSVKSMYGINLFENTKLNDDGVETDNPGDHYNTAGFFLQFILAPIWYFDYFFTKHTYLGGEAGKLSEEKPAYGTLAWLVDCMSGAYPVKFLLIFMAMFIGMGGGSNLMYDITYTPFQQFLKGLARPDRMNVNANDVSSTESIEKKIGEAAEAAVSNAQFLMEVLPKIAIGATVAITIIMDLCRNGPDKWFLFFTTGKTERHEDDAEKNKGYGIFLDLIVGFLKLLAYFIIFAVRVGVVYVGYPLIYLSLIFYFMFHSFCSVFYYKPLANNDSFHPGGMFIGVLEFVFGRTRLNKYIYKIDEKVSFDDELNGFKLHGCEDTFFGKLKGFIDRLIRFINLNLFWIITIVFSITAFTYQFKEMSPITVSILAMPLVLVVAGYIYRIKSKYDVKFSEVFKRKEENGEKEESEENE